MGATLRPFSLPLSEPLVTSAGRIERRDGVLVHVEGSDGVTGLGEATPLPGWTEPLEDCERALEAAVDRIAEDGPCSALATLSETPAARHGLSLALADREARRDDRPLYRVLGGERRVESVPVNATIGDGSIDETVEAADAAIDAGFACLKVKVGARPVSDDVDRLTAVHEAVDAETTLRADANGAWDRRQARTAFDEFANLGVEYVEQPLPADDLDGLAALQGGPVGVALDESLAREDPARVIEMGAADVLVVKPMVLGGLDRARSVTTAALDAGLGAVVTTTIDALVARTAAVHLAASLPDPAPAGLATADRLGDDLGADPAPVVDGRIRVPETAGHGVELEGPWQ